MAGGRQSELLASSSLLYLNAVRDALRLCIKVVWSLFSGTYVGGVTSCSAECIKRMKHVSVMENSTY